MVMMKHPLSRTEYHRNDDGTVYVVKTSTGVSGLFDRSGAWLDGERRTADPALCMWVADGGGTAAVRDDDEKPEPPTASLPTDRPDHVESAR